MAGCYNLSTILATGFPSTLAEDGVRRKRTHLNTPKDKLVLRG